MPSVETEATLKKVARLDNVVGQTVEDKGELIQEAVHILSHKERENLARDKAEVDKMFSPTNAQFLKKVDPLGIKRLKAYQSYINKKLAKFSPRPVDAPTRDALYARQKALEAEIRQGMPPIEVMRKNPVNAVGWHQRWDRANKRKILEWKNIVRTLEPDNDDKDLSNVEKLRPSMYQQGGPNTHMVGAQIQGFESYSHISDDLWKQTFGEGSLYNVNSPYGKLVEAEKADGLDQDAEAPQTAEEVATLRAQVAALTKQLATKEEKAAMQKAARQLGAQKARESRKAKLAQPQT